MKLRNKRHYPLIVWPTSMDDPFVADGVFDVPGATDHDVAVLARSLLDQPDNYEPADDQAEQALAELRAAPAFLAALTQATFGPAKPLAAAAAHGHRRSGHRSATTTTQEV